MIGLEEVGLEETGLEELLDLSEEAASPERPYFLLYWSIRSVT